MKILITGANGFVGRRLVSLLQEQGHQLLLAMRSEIHSSVATIVIGDIETFDDWANHLAGIDTVIHLAARIHQMGDRGEKAKCQYQRTNVDATMRLAEGTIKVNGEKTMLGQSFSSADIPSPKGVYAESKLKAEDRLKNLLFGADMELVIIRPPLVYGPDVSANFLRLVKLGKSGMPLPFVGLNNRRDMVSVDNLCDFIVCCIVGQTISGKTFLVSDGTAHSTADIITLVRSLSGLPQRLFYFPPVILKILLTLAGKKALVDRLFGSLEIDMSDTIETLDWTPKYTLEQTLRQMVS
jgi:nucleoside-diphosphate-sugar epimerase